jgi:outer membrane protein assembly factor BamA
MCKLTVAQNTYPLQYTIADATLADSTLLQNRFASQLAAIEYVAGLPALLQTKGYVTASVDSTRFDSTGGQVYLFLGQAYKWASVATNPADADVLEAVRWNQKLLSGTPMNFAALQAYQERMLAYLEENGHPFAKIFLDSVQMLQNEVSAVLQINRGPKYKIDSIKVIGDVNIDNRFLQRYLDIPNESFYNKKKLQNISRRIAELNYVQEERPSNLSMLGTGSVLNLYLKPKKSSQVNVLIGFLPNSDATAAKKFLITGEANVLLRNALGAGETIGLNWQQLQQQSPRLNILYDHPFVFQSSFGLNFTFDMFRKDTTFLNINMKLGATYSVSGGQSATVFLQRRNTIVNGINVVQVMQSKRLPQDADVSAVSLGVTYDVNTTNYRFNPQRGSELVITAAAGTKKLKKNNQILELKDPFLPDFDYEQLYDTVKMSTYQFRVNALAARYFPLGKQSTIKTAVNAAVFQSGNIFRNELFQIGGYKLLRGFDEESQFVSQYAIATAEYRYLIGMNSNFFAFVDGGWARHPMLEAPNHAYVSSGAGLSFETKAGIFNIVWAVGKRDDTDFNLRQSKIHLGFVNYF